MVEVVELRKEGRDELYVTSSLSRVFTSGRRSGDGTRLGLIITCDL